MVSAIDIGCQTTARGSVLGRVFLYVSGYFFRRWPLPEQEGGNASGNAATSIRVDLSYKEPAEQLIEVVCGLE